MLKNFLVATMFCFCASAMAQKTSYRSYNYAGVLEGQKKTGYQVLTTHGLQLGTYFIGLGAGVDSYRKWSLPVFLAGSKYLFPKKNKLFLNINIGANIVFNQADNLLGGGSNTDFLPGLFAETGFGYRLQTKSMKPGEGILFGAYYSYKAFKERQTTPGFCIDGNCPPQVEYLNYQLNRWAFKIGFVL